ncbi:GNAT family N-acetyltransferase [Paenibacillus lemnae]|uniref:GNAT family N-acetyltransferase n=1 Tax=Paenibacillus lemnae TaxID=1330551 RepID=A0A848MCC7_PAELE|nr:GNAT family N-acetyltransferase [Paenibacillus lemnae]NMO97692.1 GNAT family N-acetyltransferase [Paenibacillus lemnae]
MNIQPVDIVRVEETQKSVLRQLIELYEYDFSEFNDRDVNDYGLYDYKYFDYYWTEQDRHPYFIKVENKYAGFILINNYCYLQQGAKAKSIAEFFVMRKYRRRGVGQKAAVKIFDMHQGDWEVLQHGNNEGSKFFWKKVIEEYTDGAFELLEVDTEFWKGQGYIFNNVFRKGELN